MSSEWNNLTESRAAKIAKKQAFFANLRKEMANSGKVFYEMLYNGFWEDKDFTPQEIMSEVLGPALTVSLFTDGAAYKTVINNGQPGTITLVAPGDIAADPVTGLPRLVFTLEVTGPEGTVVSIVGERDSGSFVIDGSGKRSVVLGDGIYTVTCSCEGYTPNPSIKTVELHRDTAIKSELTLIPPPTEETTIKETPVEE